MSEKRLHTRHRALTQVFVRSGGKNTLCKAHNLSANGVSLHPADKTRVLGLHKGQQVFLTFAINLGKVVKLHRRTAIVAHVTNGKTGMFMEQFKG